MASSESYCESSARARQHYQRRATSRNHQRLRNRPETLLPPIRPPLPQRFVYILTSRLGRGAIPKIAGNNAAASVESQHFQSSNS